MKWIYGRVLRKIWRNGINFWRIICIGVRGVMWRVWKGKIWSYKCSFGWFGKKICWGNRVYEEWISIVVWIGCRGKMVFGEDLWGGDLRN